MWLCARAEYVVVGSRKRIIRYVSCVGEFGYECFIPVLFVCYHLRIIMVTMQKRREFLRLNLGHSSGCRSSEDSPRHIFLTD